MNRLDELVLFNPLRPDNLLQIVQLLISEISDRLASRINGASLTISDAAARILLEEAYDPFYGARPLRRHLERRIVTQLSVSSDPEIQLPRTPKIVGFKASTKPFRRDCQCHMVGEFESLIFPRDDEACEMSD